MLSFSRTQWPTGPRRPLRMVAMRFMACTGMAAVGLTALCGAAVSVGANLAVPAAPFSAPYVPASESDVLQDVPSTADPAVLKMQTLRTAFDATFVELVAEQVHAIRTGEVEAAIAVEVDQPGPIRRRQHGSL